MAEKVLTKESLSDYTSALKNKIKEAFTNSDYQALSTLDRYKLYLLKDKGVIWKNVTCYGKVNDGNYVTLEDEQDIAGTKTFSNSVITSKILNENSDDTYYLPRKSGTIALLSDCPESLRQYIYTYTLNSNVLTLYNYNSAVTTFNPTFPSTMTYKGIISSSSLPSSATRGDFYILSDQSGYQAIYNGSSWDKSIISIEKTTSVSSSNTKVIKTSSIYSYVNNYHDATKLNINGSINISNTIPCEEDIIFNCKTTDNMIVCGGNNVGSGSSMLLASQNYSGGESQFYLKSCGGGYFTSYSLVGNVNELRWMDNPRILIENKKSSASLNGSGAYTTREFITCFKLCDKFYYIVIHGKRNDYYKMNKDYQLAESITIEGNKVLPNQEFTCGNSYLNSMLGYTDANGKLTFSFPNERLKKNVDFYFGGFVLTE